MTVRPMRNEWFRSCTIFLVRATGTTRGSRDCTEFLDCVVQRMLSLRVTCAISFLLQVLYFAAVLKIEGSAQHRVLSAISCLKSMLFLCRVSWLIGAEFSTLLVFDQDTTFELR